MNDNIKKLVGQVLVNFGGLNLFSEEVRGQIVDALEETFKANDVKVSQKTALVKESKKAKSGKDK